jgi:pSer/pThr/pTyr-binding forkhead associated (FHA) protein
MNTQAFIKFCPACHLDNAADATICQHCSAPLNITTSGAPTTRHVNTSSELADDLAEQIIKNHPLPSEGMALHLLNSGQPVGLCMEPEFILGRADDTISEPMFDVTRFDAFALGVSRRHAIIKAAEDKYVLTDANSSNGTWLNGNRLLPNKPHDLPSGSIIQLGRLKLVVVYVHPPGIKKV